MTGRSDADVSVTQIALSCIDLVETERWFRGGLGFALAGGTRLLHEMPVDMPPSDAPAEAVCWWMRAGDSGVRLALLQFAAPLPRLQPPDVRPCDLGYARIGVYVPDFRRALQELERLGSPPVGPVLGGAGERRACVRTPDGVFVEIMERDPLPEAHSAREAPAIRSVTVSTADLDAALAAFGTSAVPAPEMVLHDDADEALWGLAGARCRRAVLCSGDVLLELAQYVAPAGKPPAADVRSSDQGIRNVVFGDGTEPQGGPNDVPAPAEYTVESAVEIAVPYDRVWAVLNDHDRMHEWIEADTFEVTKHGWPDSAGYGAERLLVTLGRRVLQQVVRVVPGRIGYRAIAGTPFSYHNGTIDVRAIDGGTRIVWTIRFRTADPSLGEFVRGQLRNGIPHQLEVLKAMIEGEAGA